ncbi:hypothetical protein [Pyrodictium occultum]|uniref:hypothetical protein n=1 Tax=Pyrodictium occultum TaxID=2309 RepID=UPI000ACADC8B|nr:hypothetical protein [Pyrodictium occultum]
MARRSRRSRLPTLLLLALLLLPPPVARASGGGHGSVTLLVDGEGVVWVNASLSAPLEGLKGLEWMNSTTTVAPRQAAGGNASYTVISRVSAATREAAVAGLAATGMRLRLAGRGGSGVFAFNLSLPGMSAGASGVYNKTGHVYRVDGVFSASIDAGNETAARSLAERIRRLLNPVVATAALQGFGVRVDSLNASVEASGSTVVVGGSFTAFFDYWKYVEKAVSGLAAAGALSPEEADKLLSLLREAGRLSSMIDTSRSMELVLNYTGNGLLEIEARSNSTMTGPREALERMLAYTLLGSAASITAVPGAGGVLPVAGLAAEGLAARARGNATISSWAGNGTVAYRVQGLGIYKPGASPAESAEAAVHAVAELLGSRLGLERLNITLVSRLPLEAPQGVNTSRERIGGSEAYVVRLASPGQLAAVKFGQASSSTGPGAATASPTGTTTTGTATATTAGMASTSPTAPAAGGSTGSAATAAGAGTASATPPAAASSAGAGSAAAPPPTGSRSPGGMSPAALTLGFAAVAAVVLAAGLLVYRRGAAAPRG